MRRTISLFLSLLRLPRTASRLVGRCRSTPPNVLAQKTSVIAELAELVTVDLPVVSSTSAWIYQLRPANLGHGICDHFDHFAAQTRHPAWAISQPTLP